MTKINTIDMVYNIPYNHTYVGTLANTPQYHPTYVLPTLYSSNANIIYIYSNKKYFDFGGTTRAIRTQGIILYTTGSDIQFECDFIPRSNKRHVLYTIALTENNTTNDTTAIFQVYVNVSSDTISVKLGTYLFTCNYIFERNVEYNILVTMTKESGLSININGESVSSFDYGTTINAFNAIATANYYHFFGHHIAANSMPNVGLDGYATNIYSSTGMIHRSHEDYTTNNYNKLLHFKLDNVGDGGVNFQKSNTDIVNTLDVNFIQTIVGKSYKVDSNFNFTTNQSYYIIFGMDVKNSLDGIELFNNDQYKVLLNVDIITDTIPEPVVVVNEYSKSALDFENGIIDQGVTVWNKTGTGDITTDNHIFGENSFETKALGDSLYTNSNGGISGGATPFTIEFYALVKDNQPTTDSNYKPLFVNIDSSTNANNGLYINHPNNNLVYIYADEEDSWDFQSKNKIQYNEINKITISYDGAALRIFINDMMVNVIGTYYISHSKLTMLSMGSEYNNSMIKGLIDNVNIFDGIATKVRDSDPYEEFLVVDLAFDGENNSTKIVDNGTAKLNWTVNGNAKLSATQKFDGVSSLEMPDMTSYIRSDNNLLDFNFTNSYTIQFDFMIRNETNYHIFFANYASDDLDQCMIFYNHVTKNIHARPIDGISSAKQFVLPYTVLMNVKYNFVMLFENGVYNFYINGVLVLSNESTKKFNFSSNGTTIGQYYQTGSNFYLDGFIKNFKIYKGVAVIPENPTGKIQLDFDNNVIDKYNNSTWTNNGVTFDQVNSVKGNSAYFNGSSYITSASNQNLNFENKSFKIQMDFKSTNTTKAYSVLLSTGHTSSGTNKILNLVYGSSKGFYFNKENILTISAYNVLPNQYYNTELIRKNGTLFLKLNDNIVGVYNSDTEIIDYSEQGTTIGAGLWGSSLNHTGYIDNFKTIKENLTLEYTGDEGVWIQAVTHVKNTSMANKYDFNNTSIPLYDEYYKNTISFASLFYRNTSGATGLKNTSIIINKSVLNKSFLIDAVNGTYYNSDILVTLEILNSNGFPIAALKWIRETTYCHRLYYGSNLNMMTATAIKGAYPRTLGVITFKEDGLYFVHDDTVAQANLSFYFDADLSGASSIRITNLYAYEDYSNGSAYFSMKLEPKSLSNFPETVIDKPAVHFPLETNATNVGFADLTINSVGSPTYTTVDGRKCIKFESGKYLSINSNNIFNLGASSDFYMEFDFYPIKNRPSFILLCSASTAANANLFTITCVESFSGSINAVYTYLGGGNYKFEGSYLYNAWNKIKIFRIGNLTTYVLNDAVVIYAGLKFDFASNSYSTYIGNAAYISTTYFDGYMSNFKMFVGTYEIPETYHDKKVLDLDFKPTRKSYLFKDNNNKCVIHPVNITQRDYINSQYACTFNGTNQYLQLGKNDLLNFGNDDFVICLRFYLFSYEIAYQTIIASDGTTGTRPYITVFGESNSLYRRKIRVGATGGIFLASSTNDVNIGLNECYIIRQNNICTIILNGVSTIGEINSLQYNLNYNNDTNIGRNPWDGVNGYFKGTIYSIKVLRNTSDITLLEDEVNTTVNLEYTLLNTTTEESETISSNKLKDIIQIERTSDSISLHVGEEMISLNAPSVDETDVDLFTDYRDHIQSEIIVYDQRPDAPSTYLIPPLDYSSIEAEEVDGMDTLTEIQVVDAGDYIVDGFTEGYPDAKFRIVNRTTNEVLTYGVDSYYHGGINPVYIKNYYVYLYELGIEYPLEDHKMEKGSITYYLNTTLNACVGADYRVRLMRRMDGRVIGEYEFKDGFCTVSNLDRSVAYDAILFDKTNKYESVTMSNRIPLAVE